MKAAIEDRNLSEKIGIERLRECLGYRLVTKNMEKIGDHVVRIAKNMIEMENEMEPDDPIFKMAEDVQTIFKQSITLLSNLDPMETNMVIENAKKISLGGTALYKNRQSQTHNNLVSLWKACKGLLSTVVISQKFPLICVQKT